MDVGFGTIYGFRYALGGLGTDPTVDKGESPVITAKPQKLCSSSTQCTKRTQMITELPPSRPAPEPPHFENEPVPQP